MTKLSQTRIVLPGARIGPENPLPIFRSREPDRQVSTDGSLPPEKLEKLGWQTGFRVLPYRMQDSYTRQREPVEFNAVVLENEHLRATFLPEMGGRLVSLVDLDEDRELLFFNPVFQPANLAIRNAWFAGGIEWNIGQYGHAFHTCSPIFAAQIVDWNGDAGLRLYDYERCKGLFWNIDFYLPQGSQFLVAYTRVINPNPGDTAMYWWTNIAVPESDGQRVLAPADQAIFMQKPGSGGGFGYAPLPCLPSLEGVDSTYPLNYPFANEFFFQCDQAVMPWETALDRKGHGLVEASSPKLRYRKMFCWGNHAGGRRWQEFLSEPGLAYLEIQGGLAPTQLHGLVMPAQTSWDWVQAFGSLQVQPELAHQANWERAVSEVGSALEQKINRGDIEEYERRCRNLGDQKPVAILEHGSGWGALELQRRRKTGQPSLTAAFDFPDLTMTAEQTKWLALLKEGRLPEQNPEELPGEWLVQAEWQQLLQDSLEAGENDHWYAWLHTGVMRMENGDYSGARRAWEHSLSLEPSAWVYRNLAVASRIEKDLTGAIDFYRKAWAMTLSSAQDSKDPLKWSWLLVEYLEALLQAGKWAEMVEVCRMVTVELLELDRVQILFARALLETGKLDKAEVVFKREKAVIQEGETELTDLWFDLWSLREFGKKWSDLTVLEKTAIQRQYPPPAHIDFRMSTAT